MALPSFIHASPALGSGNGTISFSADAYTGRTNRTGTATITPVGASAKTVQITQTAKAEHVEFGSASISVGKTGGALTITGVSNSSKLTFALGGTNEIGLTAPTGYTANGSSATSGTAITGDPGASSDYSFSVAFESIPANGTTGQKETTLIVTDAAGNSSQIAIQQTAGDATLSVSPTSITIPANGTAQSVTVTSNTSWTVS